MHGVGHGEPRLETVGELSESWSARVRLVVSLVESFI